MSPFAITQTLRQTENKQIYPPQPKQQVQTKRENNYMDHSIYIENQKNQSFPTSQPKPTNTVTSLYPTLTPYSYHPEHRPTSRNITNNDDHASIPKQNSQKETESAPMLPKRKKQRSLDKKLKSVIKSQNKLLQRAIHPPPNNGQKPNPATPTKKNRKYDTVVFNVNSESVDL